MIAATVLCDNGCSGWRLLNLCRNVYGACKEQARPREMYVIVTPDVSRDILDAIEGARRLLGSCLRIIVGIADGYRPYDLISRAMLLWSDDTMLAYIITYHDTVCSSVFDSDNYSGLLHGASSPHSYMSYQSVRGVTLLHNAPRVPRICAPVNMMNSGLMSLDRDTQYLGVAVSSVSIGVLHELALHGRTVPIVRRYETKAWNGARDAYRVGKHDARVVKANVLLHGKGAKTNAAASLAKHLVTNRLRAAYDAGFLAG